MTNHWLNNKNLKCVILCAGRGQRIVPYTEELPKVMIKIKNKPVLGSIVDYWKKYTNNFVFVVGFKKEQVIEYVKTLPINAEFVEQKQLKGIAHAISLIKPHVSEQFIVVLGDCYYDGELKLPKNMQQGVGVQEIDDEEYIKRNYSVQIQKNQVTKVVEKPKKVTNNLCGMGVYFFDKRVFNYIKQTKPSKLRNEIEITDVIENMIENGEKISPIFFDGNYINVTYPVDVKITEDTVDEEKIIIQRSFIWRKIITPIFKQLVLKKAQITGDKLLPFINQGDFILDFGCGCEIHNMSVSNYLAKKKHINLTGVDVVEYKIREGDFIKYEGGRLPFKDNQFEIVLATTALHHTNNTDFYLKELIRVSRDKIIICESTYNSKLGEIMAKLVCQISDFLVGDTNVKRSFKSIDEWKETFKENNVNLLTFKKFYPHPLPFVPSKNIIMEIKKIRGKKHHD